MKKIATIIVLTLTMSSGLFAQGSLKINGVNTKQYPTVSIEFTAKDASGKQLKDVYINDNDVTLLENGKIKNGTVFCPPESEPKFSTILVIDRSGSMTETIEPGVSKYDAAKTAAKAWVDQLVTSYPGRYECAIMTFSCKNYVLTDFTDNRTDLYKALNNDTLRPRIVDTLGNGTDYNAALIYDGRLHNGALKVAEHAKYPVYIVFLTDGRHETCDGKSVLTYDINDQKDKVNATIYSIILGDIPDSFIENDIEPYSDEVHRNIKNTSALRQLYQQILREVSMKPSLPPCIFTYESECAGGGDVTMSIKNTLVDASASTNFTIPDTVKPYLEFSPSPFDVFLNVPPGTTATKKVTVTARRNDVLLTNPIISCDRFRIIDWTPNYALNKDRSKEFTIEYTAPPKDSSFYPCTIEFDGTACSNRILPVAAGWIYARPVDMGNSSLNVPKTKTVNSVFCNYSGSTLNLQGVNIAGGDDGSFKVDNYGGLLSVPNNQCIDITFTFTPTEHRAYASEYLVVTSGGTWKAPITGTGIGAPEIAAVDSLIMDNHTNCKIVQAVKSFRVYNTGSLPLDITGTTITPPGEFSILPVVPMTVQAGDSLEFTVTFSPVDAGVKSADLTLTSNASNITDYHIRLGGTKDSVWYEPDIKSLDFGVLCPGQDSAIVIPLNAPGLSVDDNVTVNTSGDLGPANVGNITDILLSPGTTKSLTVTVSGTQQKDYSGTLTLKDAICGITYAVPVIWKVYRPDVTDITVTFTANVPQTDVKNVIITNNSKRDFTINKATFRNTEFYFTNSVSFPFTLTANGGTQSFSVTYKPVTEGTLQSWLVFEGDPCTYSDSVKLTGSATASSASMEIDEFRACLGETIDVPVYLRNCSKFSGSGVTKITFSVEYAPDLLEPVALLPNQTVNSPVTTVSSQPVAAQDNDQLIATLKFLVLESAQSPSSPLTLKGMANDDGAVSLTSKDGTFTAIPSLADIKIGDVNAYPGEEFNLPVQLDNVDFCSLEFHKNMIIKVRFNKTLMEPVNNTPLCIVQDEYRIADLVIPLDDKIASGHVSKFRFRSMLGNAAVTPIEVINADYESGVLEYNSVNGSLTLDVCNYGGNRLFDAADGVIPGIYSFGVNNTGAYTTLVNTIEEGENTLMISDIYGNCEVIRNFSAIGKNEFVLDLSSYSSGVYYAILKTPTQVFTYKFLLMK